MHRLELTGPELVEIETLIDAVVARHDSVESPAFLRAVTVFAQELPRRVRTVLNDFRLGEPDGVLVVAGYGLDDARIGPTPPHWESAKDLPGTLREQVYLALVSCLLGDPVAWATQQDGRVMHDILPIKEHEFEQLGSGSRELLTWHTEDAFHPLRTDYLALFCMRNPDQVQTTVAAIDDVQLDEALAEVLSQDRYPIRPDRSHLPENQAGRDLSAAEQRLIERSYEQIATWDANPDKVAVLYGAPDQPYLRMDPYFMQVPEDDPEAVAAFHTLVRRIDDALSGYSLRPGEIIFLDNAKVVHGRQPFQARFDGTDRWLKRLNISRDLRKSRRARLSPDSRVIY